MHDLRDDLPPSLSLRSTLLCLAISVGVFLALNPTWADGSIDAVNQSIWWSYAVLPLLVPILLAFERKLRWATFFLEALKLTFVKFVLTYAIATVMWAIVGPPLVGESRVATEGTQSGSGPYEPRPAPRSTPIDAARTGVLTGLVVDAQGRELSGVLVYVAAGLERFVFAPPAEELELVNDGAGLQPALSVLRTFQPLSIRSTSDELHTFQATDRLGRSVLNVPLLAGAERTLMFEEELGILRLACRVHGKRETAGHVLVARTPFAGRTGADGSFRFEGVPAGDLVVLAWDATRGEARGEVQLAPKAAPSLRLELR